MPRLILVSAPAGFGKTTLLAQWLGVDDPDRRVAWLSLDPGDDDPRRFLTHLSPPSGPAARPWARKRAGADGDGLLARLRDLCVPLRSRRVLP